MTTSPTKETLPDIPVPANTAKMIREMQERYAADLANVATDVARLMGVDVTKYMYVIERAAFVPLPVATMGSGN